MDIKKTLFVVGAVVGVSLFVVLVCYFLLFQVGYTDLVGKTIIISEGDDDLLVLDEKENVVFSYSISEWNRQAGEKWDEFFTEPIEIDEITIGPNAFTRFTAISPFPESTRRLGFAVSTYAAPTDVSLFWVIDIVTRELSLVGEENKGVVGNISWSPNRVHFAYYLNTERAAGEYLTVDNGVTFEKEFNLSGEDILEAMEEEEDEAFTPEFRSLKWSEEGEKLMFSTDTPEEDVSADWVINVDGTELTREN